MFLKNLALLKTSVSAGIFAWIWRIFLFLGTLLQARKALCFDWVFFLVFDKLPKRYLPLGQSNGLLFGQPSSIGNWLLSKHSNRHGVHNSELSMQHSMVFPSGSLNPLCNALEFPMYTNQGHPKIWVKVIQSVPFPWVIQRLASFWVVLIEALDFFGTCADNAGLVSIVRNPKKYVRQLKFRQETAF